jgi:hypothetical protein
MIYPKLDVRGIDIQHKAVLPQSWLQITSANPGEDPPIDKSLSYVLVEPLVDLLQRVASRFTAGLFLISRTIKLADDRWMISLARNYSTILSRM